MKSTMESTVNAGIIISDDKPRRKRTLDDKACEVCNDKSTGKHYGVYCCDGCSGFFKRTVRRSIPWHCRNDNQCIVDKASRTDCRACRFKKCLMVKMNPEGVQNTHGSRMSYDRTSSGNDSNDLNYSEYEQSGTNVSHHTLVPRENVSINNSTGNPLFPGSSNSPPISMALVDDSNPDNQQRSDSPVLIKVESERCNSYVEVQKNSDIVARNSEAVDHDSVIGRNNSTTIGNTSAVVGYNSEIAANNSEQLGVTSTSEMQHKNASFSHVNESTSKKSSLMIISPPVRVSAQNLVVPNTSSSHLYPYQSTHIPSSSQYPYQSTHCSLISPRYALVNHDDFTSGSREVAITAQSNSLHKMTIQLLSRAVQFAKNIPSFKSLPFRDQIILLEESWKDLFLLNLATFSFPLDASFVIPPGDANATLVSNLRGLQEIVTRIQALELDDSECEYLKTVVLFKPDIKGLKDSKQIENQQDEAQIKLSEYARTRHKDNPARFGRLLLTLSAFERISQEMIEKLFFRGQNDGVECILHDLFKKA